MWNNPELLSYVAMCIRHKLRRDQKSSLQDDRVEYRIQQGETTLKEIKNRIKELGGQPDWEEKWQKK